jgi:hypothetical protein
VPIPVLLPELILRRRDSETESADLNESRNAGTLARRQACCGATGPTSVRDADGRDERPSQNDDLKRPHDSGVVLHAAEVEASYRSVTARSR